MLKHLHIQNYALISHLDIEFEDGFSVITGETGAGKSIILGALGLLLGGRADTKSISEGEKQCVIEAEFVLNTTTQTVYLIRREINNSGRSRIFVNDELTTQTELKQLSTQLLDIHSQHANLLLADSLFQLSVVDTIAQNDKQLEDYKKAYTAYLDTKTKLSEIEELARKSKKDKDYLLFQYQQLQDAQLQADELETLETEEFQLSHAEEIQNAISVALNNLDSDQNCVLSLLRSSKVEIASCQLQERLDSAMIEIKDIAAELNHLQNQIEINPARLQFVEQRLDTINNLLHKHDCQDISQLIDLRDQLSAQLQHIDSFDDEIALLKRQLQEQTAFLESAATSLTASRQAITKNTEQKLCNSLATLGIAHAKIEIQILPAPAYSEQGKDQVQIMFAANKNQTVRAISDVASGGEISRVMLCIKALIADCQNLPTIIFDEIDTGVSGQVANNMGVLLQKMAAKRQVIVITHLPQIASKASIHFKVYKADTELRTETHLRQLSQDERVAELASLLYGNAPTESALQNAREMLNLL